MTESLIQSEILGLSTGNVRLWRTNAGMGWAGRAMRQGSTVVIQNARPLHAMPEGWPDLTGFVSVTITPDMVGRTVAIFAAPEIKAARGVIKESQKSFREMFLSMGAIAGICRSVDDARKLLTL